MALPLHKISHALDLQGKLTITLLPGNENENYLVKSAQQSAVVKHLRSAYTIDEVELEGLYRQRLAKDSLPLAPYLTWHDGRFVQTIDGSNYVATPFVPGVMAAYSEDLAEQTAKLLAHVHLTNAAGLPERRTWFREGYVAEVLEGISDKYADVKRDFAGLRQSLPDFWHAGLPRGIVHGDLHNENIIVDEQGQVASLIDWEETAIAPLILDIAHTARSMSFHHGVLNEVIFNAFVASYQDIRPLTDLEKELFGPAIRYSALILSVWAYGKASQGQMDEATLRDLGGRYKFDYPIPDLDRRVQKAD